MAGAPTAGAWGSDQTSTQGGEERYYVKWTSGSSGAVPSFPLSASQGVTSVTHGSTGVYTIVLQNAYYQSLAFIRDAQQASYSSSGACAIVKTSDTPATGTIAILVTNAAGSAVDPTTNDVIELCFVVQNYKSQ
jgi:hypothetical protein